MTAVAAAPAPAAPVRESDLIPRPRLVERLIAAPPTSAILLVAPAGYGKSTLLAEWADTDPRPFACLRLVSADDNPRALAQAIARPLRSVGVDVNPLEPPDALVEDVLRAVRAADHSFVLVLDDVHKLRRRPTLQLLADLIDSVGPAGHIALAARHMPGLPVARLRAERRLVEIDAADLVFTRREVGAAAAAYGMHLDEPGRDVLTRRTEGWPAGVYLAALTMLGVGNPRQPLDNFSGADRHVTDYLNSEVLATLPRRLLDFLKPASVLTRLSGPVCDYVLERDDSARVLVELSRTNLLVLPLDRTDTEFRCHTLLAEAIRSELNRDDPGAAAALHARASSWFEHQGQPDLAIEHALAARDIERAGMLLWREAPVLVAYGRRHAAARHLRRFSQQQIVTCPPLALSAATVDLAFGNRAGTEHWIATALQARGDGARPADTQPLDGGALALRALATAADPDAMEIDAAAAYAAAANTEPWRPFACLALGIASHTRGDADAARRWLAEGARRGAAAAPAAQVLCLAQLALIASAEHDFDSAESYIAHARAQTERVRLSDYPLAAPVFAASAAIRAYTGQVDVSEFDAERATRLLTGALPFTPWYVAQSRVALAVAAVRLGELTRARQLLAAAERDLRALPGRSDVHAALDACRAQCDLAAASGEPGHDSLTAAELRVLQYFPTHLSFPEIAHELYVSRNTVKTHVRSVYRKLEASSRSEAVRRAREAGLLDPVV